mmetsp:Transcript_6390/g.19036  ORF Transcript_6390/g.19036 Transcript_6390/m.19036 type:complete len:245 (-) Transcript_6390:2355-3089(-)
MKSPSDFAQSRSVFVASARCTALESTLDALLSLPSSLVSLSRRSPDTITPVALHKNCPNKSRKVYSFVSKASLMAERAHSKATAARPGSFARPNAIDNALQSASPMTSNIGRASPASVAAWKADSLTNTLLLLFKPLSSSELLPFPFLNCDEESATGSIPTFVVTAENARAVSLSKAFDSSDAIFSSISTILCRFLNAPKMPKSLMRPLLAKVVVVASAAVDDDVSAMARLSADKIISSFVTRS